MLPLPNLPGFLDKVGLRIGEAVANPSFDAPQRQLLQESTKQALAQMRASPYDNPLGLLYLVARAWGREPDEQMEHIGAFCMLYVCSLDLFDDVQDSDLIGKAHEGVGNPIATNDAIALLFLAVQSLRHAFEIDVLPERTLRYMAAFNRASVQAVAGQHRDLSSSVAASSPAQVLSMHQAKTSSVALFVQCGALLGGCDATTCERYWHVGELLAQVVQIVDDLRDIFAKGESPDLAAQKVTYPKACLMEMGDVERCAQFAALQRQLPGSLPQVRELLYDAGVVERCAETLEDLRREIHSSIAATGNYGAHHRIFLSVVDRLAATVYVPPEVEETTRRFAPRGAIHDTVQDAFRAFLERMAPHGSPPAPSLVPWQYPHYLYEPAKETIYYPDLEGLGEEILPFHAELLGSSDAGEVLELLRAQLPAVLAHEMFHRWRHASGRLTNDSWHEEYAANRLAVSYVRRFSPATLERTLELADRVLSRFSARLDAGVLQLLSECDAPLAEGRAYGTDLLTTAVVHLEMVRRLAQLPLNLEADIAAFLSAEPAPSMRAEPRPEHSSCS